MRYHLGRVVEDEENPIHWGGWGWGPLNRLSRGLAKTGLCRAGKAQWGEAFLTEGQSRRASMSAAGT